MKVTSGGLCVYWRTAKAVVDWKQNCKHYNKRWGACDESCTVRTLSRWLSFTLQLCDGFDFKFIPEIARMASENLTNAQSRMLTPQLTVTSPSKDRRRHRSAVVASYSETLHLRKTSHDDLALRRWKAASLRININITNSVYSIIVYEVRPVFSCKFSEIF